MLRSLFNSLAIVLSLYGILIDNPQNQTVSFVLRPGLSELLRISGVASQQGHESFRWTVPEPANPGYSVAP